jgi:hypothetical protein
MTGSQGHDKSPTHSCSFAEPNVLRPSIRRVFGYQEGQTYACVEGLVLHH